jgi:hypothetical protein
MDAFDETLDFIFERARATKPVMLKLAAPPYNWMWNGLSPENFGDQIDALDQQVDALAATEAATRFAAAQWDLDLDTLVGDAVFGTRSARVHFESDPVKLHMFDGLRFPTAGREARYKQANGFEKAWAKAEAGWTFKSGLTLAQFKARREAIRDRAEAHSVAESDEKHERALLHNMADGLNNVCVNWYSVATGHFGDDTVAGQLIRTLPTTYDPNRVPSQLRFTVHMSTAPNTLHLAWRAARGQRFYIRGQRPDGVEFELILDGVLDKEWLGLGVTPGRWRFQGYATNQHGQGAESEIVEIDVAAAQAA